MNWPASFSEWLAAHSAAVQAAASVASVLLAGVLVWTTIKYARITAQILQESRKSREAAELQVKAAQSQASAAQAQATAAYETLTFLRQQLEEQLGLGRSVVQSAIASAVSSITYWKRQDLRNLAKVRGLPPTDSLLPANALSAVDHARRISPEGAQLLSDAFDDLRNARNEIESMKQVGNIIGQGAGFFDGTSEEAEKLLESAFTKIQKAQALLLYVV